MRFMFSSRALMVVRRRLRFALFALVGLAVLALAAACVVAESQEEGVATLPAVVGQVTVSLALQVPQEDSDLQERLAATALAVAAELGVGLSLDGAALPAGAGISVSIQPAPTSRADVPVRYWGAFTGFWSRREAVDLAAPADPLFLPAENAEALRLLLPPAFIDAATWLPRAEIARLLQQDAGGVALLPLDAALPGLRSLALDGIDAVRSPEAAPLVERLYLSWSEPMLDEFAAHLAQRLSVQPPQVTRIVFTGDIIPARCVYERQRALGDYAAAFRSVGPVLAAADITVGSLDAAISDYAEPVGCIENFNLLAPARTVEGLQLAGFDVISVAANHIKDCGVLGFCGDITFLDTLDNLLAAAIQPVGGGVDVQAAHAPVVIESGGVRFAFLAYDDITGAYFGAGPDSPGTAELSSAAIARDIEAARRVADAVIVLPHWGDEYQAIPNQRQRRLAAEMFSHGATLVVGNHPHVLQAVEWRGGNFVAYALGNFVYDQDWSLETMQGAALEATFHGATLVDVRILPVRIMDMHRPVWAGEGEAASILDRMRAASEALLP